MQTNVTRGARVKRKCVPVAPWRVCCREILAICDRLADAAERVRGTTLDDAINLLWRDEEKGG